MNVKEIDNVDSALRILETAVKGSVGDEEVCLISVAKIFYFKGFQIRACKKGRRAEKNSKEHGSVEGNNNKLTQNIYS